MSWVYMDRELRDEDLVGFSSFVYLITNLQTGRWYLGKKKLVRKVSRKPLKGRKRRRISYKDSDWRDYYGSNEELQKDVEELGSQHFRREILVLCSTLSEASYYEAKFQFETDALLTDQSYNGWIQVKVRKDHLRRSRGHSPRSLKGRLP